MFDFLRNRKARSRAVTAAVKPVRRRIMMESLEGRALLDYLQRNGIPYLAFRSAIPGTATGPHIHIGRPSHRY